MPQERDRQVIGAGIDVTERRQAEESLRVAHDELEQRVAERTAALQRRLTFEELISRISTEFINLGPAHIDASVQHALRLIGQFAGVDRSYVFQFSGDGLSLDNTHEWCAEGIESYVLSLKGLPRTTFPWFVDRLERGDVVAIARVADLPPEASRERAECEREGITSIILVPLSYRGALAGFLGFDVVRSQRDWGEDTANLLTIVAGIIVNALEHKRAQAVQAGQRRFLELLATGSGFSETLHSLVSLIEEQWPGMLGLILLLDEDGKRLHIGAAASLPQDYVQSIEGLEIGPMVGSCGTACYRRERVIVEDTATDARWEGLRDLALRHGLRACWSEPVLSGNGQVLGTFAMYYRRPRTPTEAELQAIEMGAHLVGVAIEHRQAEIALRESEEKFRGIVEHANIGIAIVQDARFRFLNPHFAAMLGYTVDELLGTEFMPLCTPEERDRVVAIHARRVRGEPAPTRYETAMVHKNGQRVYPEVSAGMIPYGGQQATFVCLRDITEQKRAQEALQQAYETLEQRVEERTRELSTLLEVSKNLVSNLDLEPLLGSILDELKRVVDYEGCMVFALEGDTLAPRAHRGRLPQDKAMSVRWDANGPLDRLVLQGREPVLVADTRGDSPTAQAYRASVGELQESLYPHIGSWLGVPLIAKGQVIGELALDHSQPGFFTPAHANLVMALANQAAAAMENARLYDQAGQAAALEERGRLARELHDSVTQSLYSVTMYTEAAARLISAGQHGPAAENLHDARDTAQEALREMRLLIYQLRPPLLDKGGLAVALQVRLDAVERRGGLRAELTVEGEDRLPVAVQAELHQIAQEALNNALKHAHASSVHVHLRFAEDVTCLDVQDDGAGFDPAAAEAGGGLGLPGMRERAGKLGGRLTITSAPGQGTVVSVEVPSGGG